MKRGAVIFTGLFLLCGVHALRADLQLRFSLDPDTALLYESASVFMRIRNDSLYPLEIGPDGPARLRLSVTMVDGRQVRRINQRPFFSPRRLMPDEQTDIMFDITRFFDFSHEGRYRVEMELLWNERSYAAPARIVEVVRGMELTSIQRSVPGYSNVDRVFTLRYWRRDGGEKLFLVVEEPRGSTIQGVFELGALMRVSTPRINADRHGNVVVVHQSAPNRYTRTVLKSTGEGVSLVDQLYFPTNQEALRGSLDILEIDEPLPEAAPPPAKRSGRR